LVYRVTDCMASGQDDFLGSLGVDSLDTTFLPY
jgi:hypothetical protein